ncbi:MAG: hypothetical protein WAO58_10040 [Fimbriimonadaceae bacterium]
MALRLAALIALLTFAASNYACSGPNLQARLRANDQLCYLFAGIHGAWFLLSAFWAWQRRITIVAPVFFGSTMLVHPARWLSSYGGDCGYGKLDLSLLFLLAGCGVGFWLLKLIRKSS